MTIKLALTAAAALVALAPQAASAATFIKYTNRAAFNTAAGELKMETFNSYTSDMTITGSGLDLGDFTLREVRRPGTPGTSMIRTVTPSNSGINGTTFVNAPVYEAGNLSAFLVIEFSEAITSFGGNWTSGNSGTVTLNVLGELVQQQTSAGGFFGFTSDTPFTRLELHAMTGTGTSVQFDNLTFSDVSAPVPEPASWAMMIGGLAFVGALKRRRSAVVSFA